MHYGNGTLFDDGNYKDIRDMSLDELQEEVNNITKRLNYILNTFRLSEEVSDLVIKELQDQKRELLDLMHKKVDEL